MLGSVVGEAVGGAVVVGEEAEVLEDDAPGLASPPQPANNTEPSTIELSANEATTTDAAGGTGISAALRADLRAAGVFVTDAL